MGCLSAAEVVDVVYAPVVINGAKVYEMAFVARWQARVMDRRPKGRAVSK